MTESVTKVTTKEPVSSFLYTINASIMTYSFRKFFPLFILAVFIGFSACDDDDPVQNADQGSIEMSIQGKVAGNDLAIESATYDATSAAEGFRLTRLSFFLSDLRLVELRDGVAFETPLADIAYFNMGASGVDSEVFDNIPTGDYTSIRFNFGITEEQDMTTPDDYSSTHPLGQTAEYWVDWGSYIFAKIEGKSDTIVDAVERFEAPFVFHVGVAADNTRAAEVAVTMPLRGGTNDLELDFDVSTLMQLNNANELPLTEFDHGGRFADQIVSSAVSAFTAAQ